MAEKTAWQKVCFQFFRPENKKRETIKPM